MQSGDRPSIPDGVWIKCEECDETLFAREFRRNGKVCPHCQRHSGLTGEERAAFVLDADTFKPLAGRPNMLRGTGAAAETPVALAVIDLEGALTISHRELFEGIAELMTLGKPLLAFVAGGAGLGDSAKDEVSRVKFACALKELASAKLPYILVLTDGHPEHGFATALPSGDFTLGEAGEKEQPEIALESPYPNVDNFVTRPELNDELAKIVAFFQPGESDGARTA